MAKTVRRQALILLSIALTGCVGCRATIEPITIEDAAGKLRSDGIMVGYSCIDFQFGE